MPYIDCMHMYIYVWHNAKQHETTIMCKTLMTGSFDHFKTWAVEPFWVTVTKD